LDQPLQCVLNNPYEELPVDIIMDLGVRT